MSCRWTFTENMRYCTTIFFIYLMNQKSCAHMVGFSWSFLLSKPVKNMTLAHHGSHIWTSFFWLHFPDFIQNSDSWLFRDVPMFQISKSNHFTPTPRYRSSGPPARCNASQRPCSSSMPGGFSRISWTSEIRIFLAPGKNGETPHQKGELRSVGVAPANSAHSDHGLIWCAEKMVGWITWNCISLAQSTSVEANYHVFPHFIPVILWVGVGRWNPNVSQC